MEDIVPELLNLIQNEFADAYESDKDITELMEKIDGGKATGADLDAYAARTGDLLAETLHRNISSDTLPDGRMYYNIANRILSPVLEKNYNLVADVAAAVQEQLNERAGIGIRPMRPEINRDRINGLVDLASDAEQYDDVSGQVESGVVNYTQSVATDSVHENAEFHYKAGLTPRIVRTAEVGCCQWCQDLAGTYDYSDVRNSGNDVYRRHRNCRCTVEYDPSDGSKRQNVHSKQYSWKEDNEPLIERRREYSEGQASDTRETQYLKQALRGAAGYSEGDTVKFDEKATYKVEIGRYSETINERLSTSARKVAEHGSRDSYEYSSLIDLVTGEEVDFGTSEAYNNVNHYYGFLREHPDGKYAMVHNHNTEDGLSLPDIQELEMWENLDAVVAVTNNGITFSVVSNGIKTGEYLPLLFDSVGKEISDSKAREIKQVEEATKRFTDGGVKIYDGRSQ